MKLNTAIIGCGNIGKKRIEALVSLSDFFKISALVGNSISDKNCYAEKLSKKYKCVFFTNWRDIFKKKNIQAVILSTPPHLFYEIGSEVMKRGMHLLIEKPLGQNFKEAKKLYDLSIKHKVVLKTGYNLRFDNGVEEVKNILKKKMIGKPYFCKIEYVNGTAKTNTNAIGSLLDLGSHIINLFNFFFHGSLKLNYSEGNSYEFSKIDNGYISLNINKISCLAHHSFVRWKNNFSVQIFGKKGYLILESLPKWGYQKITIGKRKYPSGKPVLKSIIFRSKRDSSWKKECKNFFELISKKNYFFNREGLDTMATIEDCGKYNKFKI
jgi:predicted dehydrogenase